MASSTQQQFQNVLSKLEKKDKEGVTKDEAYTAASIAPITGDAIAIKELPDDVKQIKTLFEEGYRESDFKKLGMGALYATAVTAGLIPVAGVVGRTAKSFLKPVIKKASDEMSSVFKTASGDTSMTPALAGDAPTINKSVVDKEVGSNNLINTKKTFKDRGKLSKTVQQIILNDNPNDIKRILHKDDDFAKAVGGELRLGKSNQDPRDLTDAQLKQSRKEVYNLTQELLKDQPDVLTVYRYGKLNAEDGVSSFTLNPKYRADNLAWQKKLEDPFQVYTVKKSDVLASPDINSFFAGGRKFDEDELIIKNDTVKLMDEYQGKKVYHATAKNFKKFGFVSKDEAADIGFHVGTPVQAERRTTKKTGERTLPLQLRTTLKPARIPDLSSFKEPKRWLAEISVNGNDKDLLRFLMQDPKDAKLILDQVENKLPIKMNGTTYYMLPDAERMGMDKKLWKDLVLESGRAVKKLNTTTSYRDRQEWFETIKKVANKNGYDSYVYKNEFEVGSASPDDLAKQIKEVGDGKRDPSTIDIGKQEDSYMLLEEDQAKGVFGTKTKGDPDFMKSKGGLLLAEGGVTMNKQMEMFDDGGLKDEGGTVDPVSGNDVPPGSTQEEVRDDIPAQLSEGEFVFPADVVRFIGLEKLMQMRQKAKMGLQKMEDMGQMGNSDEATMPDNLPFDINDLDMEDEEQYNSETTEMAQGGVIKAATGTLVNNSPNIFTQQSQFANQQLPTTNTYIAPTIPAPTAAPVGGYTPQFSGQTGQSGQTVIPTFQNLLGNTDGRYDELREYRSESGMVLKIPFINGEPIYPIPEGYTYVDPEEVIEEAPVVKSTTPTSTKVTEQDNNDNDRQREDKENMDNFGVTNPTVISLGGNIISSGRNKGRVEKSMEFSINKTMPEGVIPGTMAIASSVKDAIVNLTTGKYDEKANFTLTPKGQPNVKIGISGKQLNDMLQIPDPRDKTGKGTKVSITNPKVKKFLETRVKDAIEQQVAPDGFSLSDMEKIQAGLKDKTVSDTGKGATAQEPVTTSEGAVGSTGNLGGAYGPGGPPSQNYDDDDQNDGFDSNTGGGGSDDYGSMFNQGGLLGKRKIKPKKMKRGGLASR